ncbi:unnamed protein product [Clonostachys byssicola]|uniref:Uncharacterized protein n=1 Tax=Clonostachys byssicola TaxID=160290 RepID=A0A9N9U3K3_9HYPO|nr:unnamed protein product [Clonostachys byssicola]
MLPVDLVVACHDCARRRICHGDLEGQQMNLAQGSLAHDSIDADSLMLLITCREVLDGGYNTNRLGTSDIGGDQFADGIEILYERLEASSPERRSLNAHRGSQPAVSPFGQTLLADENTGFIKQILVPSGSEAGAIGKAGSANAVEEFGSPNSVGAVTHSDGGNVEPRSA